MYTLIYKFQFSYLLGYFFILVTIIQIKNSVYSGSEFILLWITSDSLLYAFFQFRILINMLTNQNLQ